MNKYTLSLIAFSIFSFQCVILAQFDVSPNSRYVGSSSGSATYSVSSTVGWSVTDDASWLTATKTDGSTISVTYSANTSTSSRTASITANGTGGVTETVTLTQQGFIPSLTVSPSNRDMGPESGNTVYSVSSNVGWSVSDDASWLTATKTDGSTISVSYSANTSGADRIAYILASGTGDAYQTVSLNQERVYISFNHFPYTPSASEGSTSAEVTTNLAEWSVSDDASWVTVSRADGSDWIDVNWEANLSTSSRTANVTVTGTGEITESSTVTITQQGATPFLTVSPYNRDMGPESGTTFYTVSSNVGWGVSDDASWLTATKTDGSTISVSYSANTSGADRIAYILASGTGDAYQTVSLNQERVFISFSGPPNSISASQGSESVQVYTSLSEWNVSDDASWLTVTRDGESDWIELSWEANPSTSPRTVQVTVTGTGEITESSNMTITQEGATPYLAVAPDSREMGPESGTTFYSVSSNVGWSVSDDASWLTTTKTDGSTISVSYSTNNSGTGRTANITATGTGGVSETVSLYQERVFISFSGPPNSISASQGSQSVQVYTSLAEWSVSDDASWMTVSREGTSDWINLSWEANPSTSPRTVHITVTGTGEITESSSMTITQQGAAPSLDVSPNSKEVGYETGSTVFDVASTVGWNVTDEASWLTATKTDGSTISVVYEANSATTSRSANITATGTGGLTETVSLTQAGTPYINIDPNSYEVGYFGGTEYINIVSNVEWTASSDAAWLGPTKEGNDLVVYHDENRIAIPRTGLITITGTGGISENVTINQAALEVELDIGDPEENVGPESGTLRHYIETNSYLWTVSAQADWLKASRINEGRINVTYEANPSTVPRSTSIIVDATGGVSGEFKVIQAGAVASLDVDPNSKEVSAESGTVTCNVNSNVDWSVYENATWLTATKTDESTITINYNTNLSTSVRIAVVTAEGKEGLSEMVAVTQAGAAVSIEVDPLSESVDAVSGTLTFSVNANVDWSVSDDAAWLTAVKSDETTINVSYEANTSDNPRIATITIEEPGGITVTVSVTQSGETITMDVSPKNISVSPISGTTDFSVNSNVEWNVSHDASWLTTAKTDTTTISVSYEANTSTSPRTAGITVEGTSGVTETVTVTQAGEEVILEVSPLSENLDASSGTTTFDVNSNVEWNVTDEASWFTAVKSDETTINVSYDANTTTTSRTASITVTGTGGVTVTVTITQVGAEAYLEVHPDGESVDAASGNVIFNVQANGEWNITDDASWVTVSKQNDTTILVSYEANADLIPRIAHIIVQGTGGAIATVTVTQASETITFDVSPKNQHVEASSGNISYVIDSNIDWGVSVNDSWLTVVRLDENTIGVNYDANPGINERIAYFLVFGTGGITETVTLTQAGEVPYLEVDPLTMNFGSASDSTSFTIRSNVEWSLVEDADWLSTALSGDTLLIVYSDENPGVEGRSASIVFSGDGVTSQIVTIVQAGTGSTGIMDPDVPVQFTVYPNPSHEMIYIRSSADLETGMMLSLFDASGKLMFARNVEYMVSGETIQIDISAMYPGVYILRLYHAGSISIIKVIKR